MSTAPSNALPRILFAVLAACFVASCADTSGSATGNTELNLDIVNPGCPETCSLSGTVCTEDTDCPPTETCDGATSCELGFSIDRVDYRITCAGNPPGSYPIAPGDTSGTDYNYNDSVDISGAFEVVDTRNPPVWQAVMDLPPGDCTITLSVFEDDEIVCVGSQTLAIAEDATTKYDIVLVCSLSVDLPDGMADVDGEFFFITGNLCPKLYVLNAIPSTPLQDPITTIAASEIQFRSKDPDNTCGNNCDPQTCDFSNPPQCSGAPYNSNDPLCNPAAGGDPTSFACRGSEGTCTGGGGEPCDVATEATDCPAGPPAETCDTLLPQAAASGLVCTLGGWPSASNPGGPGTGIPGGTWVNDGTPLAFPIIAANLNTVSGLPGVILPGLGGPSGTNAANSPAYPPLPNANGVLPSLVYQCDITQPGATYITVTCSDGDAECDQSKFMTLNCPGNNFCISDPIVCDSGNQCTTNGTCDVNCDPLDLPACSDPGNRCPGQGANVPDGTSCNDTPGGTQCLAGTCVECVTAAGCANNPAPPVDCQLANTCVANSCTAGGTAPSGTPCSNGLCDGTGIGAGACQFVPVDPPSQNANLSMGCTNNVTADISILPYVLTVDPGTIIQSTATAADFSGVAVFSEVFLDAAQGAVPGGVTAADLVNLVATVQIRTGGTLAGPVALTNAPLPTTCLIGGTACNPANDGASVPGSQPNTDCVPTGSFNPCQALVSIPISSDCSIGGACDLLGKKVTQCDLNGFCVTGGLPLALAPQNVGFTPAASGIVNFGYADQGTGAILCTGVGAPSAGCTGNGVYLLPAAVFTAPQALNEIKVNASGLSVALVCTMAVDAGGPDGPVPAVPDQASPTPTNLLNTFNIQVSGGSPPATCPSTLPGPWAGSLTQLDSGQPFLTTPVTVDFVACAPQGQMIGTFVEYIAAGTCNNDMTTLCFQEQEASTGGFACVGATAGPCILLPAALTCTGEFVLDADNWPEMSGTLDVLAGTGHPTPLWGSICLDNCTGTVNYNALTDTLSFATMETDCPTFLTSSGTGELSRNDCNVDADCLTLPSAPLECQLSNTCVANTCVPGGAAPAGTICSPGGALVGLCDGTTIGSSDPPCEPLP